jgi:hypothetical protein
MKMTSANTPINSQNWIDRINDSDDYIKDMMAFYKNGWADRGEDDVKKAQDRVRANIVLTFTYVEEVLNELVKMKSAANCVYLKLESFVNQSVLITIPIEKYLNEDFTKIYSVTNNIQKSSKSENYNVRFSFTFDDGNIDTEALKGDGFHRTHSKNES